ncbi:hypothetical protein [Candidatus Aalborgicola defluviihabitans]|uniref:hypothetical protein n=1 Tax=Candidatus Aalborgicola defluviihabitans TaxID=3386187 RepID=UPI0039B869E2
MADGSRVLAVAEVPYCHAGFGVDAGHRHCESGSNSERGNGLLLFGFPSQEVRTEQMLTPALGDAAPAVETKELSARLSQVPALVVTRPIIYQNLWISASIPIESALVDWRVERNAVAGAAMVLGVLLLLASGFFMVYLDRITTARQAIGQAKATLDQAPGVHGEWILVLDAKKAR